MKIEIENETSTNQKRTEEKKKAKEIREIEMNQRRKPKAQTKTHRNRNLTLFFCAARNRPLPMATRTNSTNSKCEHRLPHLYQDESNSDTPRGPTHLLAPCTGHDDLRATNFTYENTGNQSPPCDSALLHGRTTRPSIEAPDPPISPVEYAICEIEMLNHPQIADPQLTGHTAHDHG